MVKVMKSRIKKKKQRGRAELGKRNRALIVSELLRNPLTFSQLKQKLGFSPKTLTLHLRALEKEELIKREIHGRFVVYVARKPETILELRKQFFHQLLDLLRIYNSVFNEKTNILLQKVLDALKESIENLEPEAKTTKVISKTIEIPNGFVGEIGQNITNFYEKPEFKEKRPQKVSKRYSFQNKRKKSEMT